MHASPMSSQVHYDHFSILNQRTRKALHSEPVLFQAARCPPISSALS